MRVILAFSGCPQFFFLFEAEEVAGGGAGLLAMLLVVDISLALTTDISSPSTDLSSSSKSSMYDLGCGIYEVAPATTPKSNRWTRGSGVI